MYATYVAFTGFFSVVIWLLWLYVFQCLALHLDSHLRTARHFPSVGPVLAEVRFFIANEGDARYVTVYQRRSASFLRGAVCASLALCVLKFIFPSIESKGRFETQVIVEQNSIATRGFWNPQLTTSCLTPRGRLMWRRITHCPGVSSRERSHSQA